MGWMIVIQISLSAASLLTIYGYIYYISSMSRLKRLSYIYDQALRLADEAQKQREREYRQRVAEERLQSQRVFRMDLLITHGSAFGGCAAVLDDGRFRRGSLPLDRIQMFGRHPSGKDFTYYIEDQDVLFCAMDHPDEILIRSLKAPFEIREAGFGRDEGAVLYEAVIRKDILYYIILESKHEISVRASMGM